MPESATAVRKLRFPYVAALLCAACVGTAVWTWMRCSYAWSVTAPSLWRSSVGDGWTLIIDKAGSHRDRYVKLWANPEGVHLGYDTPGEAMCYFRVGVAKLRLMVVSAETDDEAPEPGVEQELTGRLVPYGGQEIDHGELALDTTASRFHSASIFGLLVGAMGCFVFAVALRHWLNPRRAFRVEKVEAES